MSNNIKLTKRTAEIHDVFFGEGYYTLSLKMAQLRDLEEILDKSMVNLLTRMMSGDWRVNELSEICRLALIGGGMNPQQAFRLVNSYLTEGYLGIYVPYAQLVLKAALLGPEDDKIDLGEPQPVTETEPASNGPTSTPIAEPTDSTPSQPSS
jgi:hypothetical protein